MSETRTREKRDKASAKCNFNTVRERDMDLFFVERALTDSEFIQLLASKTDLAGKQLDVVKAELSRIEYSLGESDITIIAEADGIKYGFLIEDKIDALAMPRQHDRYIRRGNVGVEKGEYADYHVFIFCPDKYYNANEEAQLYEHHLSYEEVRDYLRGKTDPLSAVHLQAVSQAIAKAKKPVKVVLNESANDFFRHYREYQIENYPELDIRTKETSNGYWVNYNTPLRAPILHKMQEGYVDLTLKNAGSHTEDLQMMAEWLRRHGMPLVIGVKTANAGALRINVPKLKMKEPFERTDQKDIIACFDAVRQLNELATFLSKSLEVKKLAGIKSSSKSK